MGGINLFMNRSNEKLHHVKKLIWLLWVYVLLCMPGFDVPGACHQNTKWRQRRNQTGVRRRQTYWLVFKKTEHNWTTGWFWSSKEGGVENWCFLGEVYMSHLKQVENARHTTFSSPSSSTTKFILNLFIPVQIRLAVTPSWLSFQCCFRKGDWLVLVTWPAVHLWHSESWDVFISLRHTHTW